MELAPEELLFAALVRLAIKDARQTKNERLRQDALQWLWWVAPAVAEWVGVMIKCERELFGLDSMNKVG